MSRFTVLGAQGFIGARLVERLRGLGHEVDAPPRDASWLGHKLGIVFYAIGVTHDFRSRPLDTVNAHVSRLGELLARGQFDSLVYLSSTRVYQGLSGTVDEMSELLVNPTRAGDLYNLSKLTGESLALASGRPVRVVRLSNAYDAQDRSGNFLSSVLRAADRGDLTLETTPDSTRDFVSLSDVVSLLPRIALAGRHWLYNLASGTLLSNSELFERIRHMLPCPPRYSPQAQRVRCPRISIARLQSEFDYRPASLLDELPSLLEAYRMGALAAC